MANTNKNKKHTKRLTLDDLLKDFSSVHMGQESSDLMENKTRKTIHHDMTIYDAVHKFCELSISLPQLMSGHITCKVDNDTKKKSWYVYPEIYGNWPLGRNPGEDPVGDKFKKFLDDLYDTYCKELDSKDNEALRKKICLLRSLPSNTPVAQLVNHPVRWERYQDGHEKAGDINLEKSPTVRFTIWYCDVDPAKAQATDFVVNQGMQKILTGLIDRRKDFYNNSPVKDEQVWDDEFTYTAGDYAKQKYPFRMRTRMEIITPKVYFSSKGSGDFQFKISKMEVYRKYESSAHRGPTEEETLRLMRETEEADQYFNHKRLAEEVVEDDVDREVKKAKIGSENDQ